MIFAELLEICTFITADARNLSFLFIRSTDVRVRRAGSLLFNPINAWLLCNYDFRVAFRFSAALILTVGTLGCWSFTAADRGASAELLQDGGDDDDRSVDAQWLRRSTTSDVVGRPEIALWYTGNCLSYLGFYMPFVNLVLLPVSSLVMQLCSFGLERLGLGTFSAQLAELIVSVSLSWITLKRSQLLQKTEGKGQNRIHGDS